MPLFVEMEVITTTELKEKFIEALKGIDFNSLTLCELQIAASISQMIENIGKKDYTEVLADMAKSFNPVMTEPKKLSELVVSNDL